jgi:hypothetical protein
MRFCLIWWVKRLDENNKINNAAVDTSATAYVTMP